VQRGS